MDGEYDTLVEFCVAAVENGRQPFIIPVDDHVFAIDVKPGSRKAIAQMTHPDDNVRGWCTVSNMHTIGEAIRDKLREGEDDYGSLA